MTPRVLEMLSHLKLKCTFSKVSPSKPIERQQVYSISSINSTYAATAANPQRDCCWHFWIFISLPEVYIIFIALLFLFPWYKIPLKTCSCSSSRLTVMVRWRRCQGWQDWHNQIMAPAPARPRRSRKTAALFIKNFAVILTPMFRRWLLR